MSSIEQQPAPAPAKPDNTKGRGKAFLIFFIVLLIIGTGGLLYWLHERNFESTDDAQVDAHLNPVSARVDGNIVHVYVDDNQAVQVGQPLVDLDERDFQVSLDQVLAQLSQARSMVIAQRPNVPITQVRKHIQHQRRPIGCGQR